MLKERLAFIERALKSKHFTLPERRDLLWELECVKLEIEKQNDTEYVNRVAKLKTEAYLDEISDKLVIRRK